MRNAIENRSERLAKGVNVIDLVKVLKIYRRKRPLTGVSAATEALFEKHILPTKWYPLESFLELLDIAYRELLGSDEENAVQMGKTGGLAILQGIHKAFVQVGDPVGSVMAMRHTWPTYFNFGEIKAQVVSDSGVLFTIIDYVDITFVHAMTTIGWGIAAAQLGGATGASYQVLERPWEGAQVFKYQIDVDRN